jgi:hypothetical protein
VKKAPTVISGDNVYVVWFTNKGTPNSNGEVIFRPSTDGGAAFGEKINLSNSVSNSSYAHSIDRREIDYVNVNVKNFCHLCSLALMFARHKN